VRIDFVGAIFRASDAQAFSAVKEFVSFATRLETSKASLVSVSRASLALAPAWTFALLALACGQSHSDVTKSGAGGTASSGGGERAMSGGVGGSAAGASALPMGGRAAAGSTGDVLAGHAGVSTGGAGLASGNAGGISADVGGGGGAPAAGTSAGGAMTGGAGETGAAGEPSTAGAGGSSTFACEGSYAACGCGCCGAVTNTACYYPEHGDDLAAIKASDQSIAMSPSCAQAGCSTGVQHVCCEAGAVDPQASYGWYFFSDDTGNAHLTRTEGERCTSLVLPWPTGGSGAVNFDFPDAWPVAGSKTMDGACDSFDESPPRDAIGALGYIHPTSCSASFDIDFTLFFRSDDGSIDAVRFKADGVTFQSNGGPLCP
jgi:hypothetical protein